MYTDTGFIKTKSLAQNTCYQGYSSENFIKIIPMRDQKDAPDSLLAFAHDVGAPAELISGHANLLVGPQCEFAKKARFLTSNKRLVNPTLNVIITSKEKIDF